MERENSRRPPDPRSLGVGPRIRKQQSHRNGVGLKLLSRRCPAGCREGVLFDNIKLAVTRMPEQAADADYRLAWRDRLPREPATLLRLAAKRAVAHRAERIERRIRNVERPAGDLVLQKALVGFRGSQRSKPVILTHQRRPPRHPFGDGSQIKPREQTIAVARHRVGSGQRFIKSSERSQNANGVEREVTADGAA